MKNLNVVFALLIATVFMLASCQKDSIEEFDTEITDTQSTEQLISSEENTSAINEKGTTGQYINEDVTETAFFPSLEAFIRTQNSQSQSRDLNANTVPTDLLYCGYSEKHNTIDGYNALTTGNNPCYNGSAGFSGPDQHYFFNVDYRREVTISISELQVDLDLFVFTLNSHGDISNCKASSTKPNRTTDAVTLTLNAGSYLVSVDGWASNIAGSYRLKVSCDDIGSGCKNLPSNCREVRCTPEVPIPTEAGYACKINASYTGDKEVAYWEIDGQTLAQTTSNDNTPSFWVDRPGTYTICCYFYCDGVLYKCCTTVTCPPIDEEPEPHCENDDDFSQYRTGRKIAEQSYDWRTWDRGKEGSSQDALVTTASTGRHILNVVSGNDVVHDLGNKRSGVHTLSTRIWVRSGKKAYYNIQDDYNRNVGGGYWSITFSNGKATMAHTSYSFSYASDEWMEIDMTFNTRTDEVQLVCSQGGRVIGRKTLYYSNYSIRLGGINFYGPSNSEYYVDYVKLNCDDIAYPNNHATSGNTASSSRSSNIQTITEADIAKMQNIKTIAPIIENQNIATGNQMDIL